MSPAPKSKHTLPPQNPTAERNQNSPPNPLQTTNTLDELVPLSYSMIASFHWFITAALLIPNHRQLASGSITLFPGLSRDQWCNVEEYVLFVKGTTGCSMFYLGEPLSSERKPDYISGTSPCKIGRIHRGCSDQGGRGDSSI